MSTSSKKEVVGPVNGTDELFQVSQEFVEDSMWVFIADADGVVSKIVQPSGFSGGYFNISPAPTADMYLYCLYEIENDDLDDDSFSVDGVSLDTIAAIIELINTQNSTIATMDKAISNRITTKDFTKYAESVNTQLEAMQTQVNAL